MKPPHEQSLRPNTTLDSPATRGKLPSPERGGDRLKISVFTRPPNRDNSTSSFVLTPM